MTTRHFLRLSDCSKDELNDLVQRAIELKRLQQCGTPCRSCQGKVLAMVFEMASTRTRVSFETGMAQLGGTSLFLSPQDTHLGRNEPIVDTSRVLAKMVDIVMIRTGKQETVEEFASVSRIPVINGMTSATHPCQLLADIQTYVEFRGSISGKSVAFVGDGYNLCHSYIEASVLFDFELRIATPPTHLPAEAVMQRFGKNVHATQSPTAAVEGVDLVVTDVWSSMGHEADVGRASAFNGFQVSEELLDLASPDALFFHCLPAHRGEEVNDTVLDDPRSVVFEEAGNRLHSQKALLEFLLN